MEFCQAVSNKERLTSPAQLDNLNWWNERLRVPVGPDKDK